MQATEPREVKIVSMEFIFRKHRHILLSAFLLQESSIFLCSHFCCCLLCINLVVFQKGVRRHVHITQCNLKLGVCFPSALPK